MPLQLPVLDDRTYDDLVREALALVPAVAPEWTNHNAADPGITLIEMLAYLTEILIYRTDQIGDRQLAAFISLLTGKPSDTTRPLSDQIRDAVLTVRRGTGAVTSRDWERLVKEAAPEHVARVCCLPGYNLTIKVEERRRPGHISVIVVPVPKAKERHPAPSAELLASIRQALEDYRPVTTRLHVVGPQYVPVEIEATLALVPNVRERKILRDVRTAIEGFFSPVSNSPETGGWDFGRDIYLSELYNLIERQPGIDYVQALELATENPARLTRNEKKEVVALDLRENELPLLQIKNLHGVRSPAPGPEDISENGGLISAG